MTTPTAHAIAPAASHLADADLARLRAAMDEAGLGYNELDGVAATAGPGLVGGVMVGLAIPLAVSLKASTSVVEILIWGVATVAVQLLVFRLVDLVLRGLPQRIQDGEMSAAALLVAAKIASALVLAAAVAA